MRILSLLDITLTLVSSVTNNGATLIDNIFTNDMDRNESFVILNNIFYHLMICIYCTTEIVSYIKKKFIEIEASVPLTLQNV